MVLATVSVNPVQLAGIGIYDPADGVNVPVIALPAVSVMVTVPDAVVAVSSPMMPFACVIDVVAVKLVKLPRSETGLLMLSPILPLAVRVPLHLRLFAPATSSWRRLQSLIQAIVRRFQCVGVRMHQPSA